MTSSYIITLKWRINDDFVTFITVWRRRVVQNLLPRNLQNQRSDRRVLDLNWIPPSMFVLSAQARLARNSLKQPFDSIFSYKSMAGSSQYRFGVLAKIVKHMKNRHLDGDDHPLTIEDILDETNQLDIGSSVKNVRFSFHLIEMASLNSIHLCF